MPTNTKKNNAWVESVSCLGRKWNKAIPFDPVPDGLLASHDASTVSKYLRYFILETRATDGSKYLPSMIYYALYCLDIKYLRHRRGKSAGRRLQRLGLLPQG